MPRMHASLAMGAIALALAAAPLECSGEHHNIEFVVEEWVVDFLRPTVALPKRKAERQTPFSIPDENRKSAILVNGKYPGETIEVFENDTVSINVVNRMISEATSIHWHGIHPYETPWTDGTVGVSQAPIAPGENFTYTFKAWPAGTHYWHSHMDGMQSAKGLRGAFIVKERDVSNYPVYDEDKLVILADEWQNPDVCLKLEGASKLAWFLGVHVYICLSRPTVMAFIFSCFFFCSFPVFVLTFHSFTFRYTHRINSGWQRCLQ